MTTDTATPPLPTRIAGRRPLLPLLTGLRFVACFTVFLVHVAQESMFKSTSANNDYTSVLWQGGWVGVSFFFVLSGFVLTWTARPGDNALTFWRRRFVRIFPNHWVTLIITIGLTAWIAKQAIDWGQAAINSGLIQSFFADINIRTGFNGVTWTLSCEAFFYVCFPLLSRWLARIREERLWSWIIGTMAVTVAIPLLATLLPNTTTFAVTGLRDWDLYLVMMFPPARIFEFILGILLARLIISGRRFPFGLGTASAILIFLWAIAGMFPGRYQVMPLSAIPVALVIGTAARQDLDGLTPAWARGRLVLWLGEMSFAFYMVHRIVVVFGHMLLGETTYSTPATVGIIVLFAAIAMLLGWALMVLVERPLMKKFGAYAKPKIRAVEPPKSDDQTPVAA